MKTKIKQFSRRSLATLLSLMMVISSVFVGSLDVHAATTNKFTPGDVIYFKLNGQNWTTASAKLYADFMYANTDTQYSRLMGCESVKDAYLTSTQISKLIPLTLVEGTGNSSVYSFTVPDYNDIGYVKVLRTNPNAETSGINTGNYQVWNTFYKLSVDAKGTKNAIKLTGFDAAEWTSYTPPLQFKSTATPAGAITGVSKDVQYTGLNVEAQYSGSSDGVTYNTVASTSTGITVTDATTNNPKFTVTQYGKYTLTTTASKNGISITRTFNVNVADPNAFTLYRYYDIDNVGVQTNLSPDTYKNENSNATMRTYSSSGVATTDGSTALTAKTLYYNSVANCYTYYFKDTDGTRNFYNIKKANGTYVCNVSETEGISVNTGTYDSWNQQFSTTSKEYYINYYPDTGKITVTAEFPDGVIKSKVYAKDGIPGGSAAWGTSATYTYDVESDTIGTTALAKSSDYSKVPTGSSVVIKTTVHTAQDTQGYYVDSFVVNGVSYKVASNNGRAYTSVPIEVTEDLEITPVYYNKNFEYITVYVKSSPEAQADWGTSINAYTWYESGGEMNGAYPGQPFGKTSSGLYVGKIPKYSYSFSGSTATEGGLVSGIAVSNGHEEDAIHDKFLTSEQKYNLQTYDFDDFVKIAEMGYDAVKLELKHYDGNGSIGHYDAKAAWDDTHAKSYKNTNTYDFAGGNSTDNKGFVAKHPVSKSYTDAKNPYEELYNFDGNAISAIGYTSKDVKRLTSTTRAVGDNLEGLLLKDGTTTLVGTLNHGDAAVKIVSVGNQDGSFGKWETVWYVFDTTTGNLITSGSPSDFIIRGHFDDTGAFDVDDDEDQTEAYRAVKGHEINGISAAYYAAAISYESEQNSVYSNKYQYQTGIRMDARWLYASSYDTFKANVKIMYADGSVNLYDSEGKLNESVANDKDSWTADTYENDASYEGGTTGASAYMQYQVNNTPTDKKRSFNNINRNKDVSITTEGGTNYKFIGWYRPVYEEVVSGSEVTYNLTGYEPAGKSKAISNIVSGEIELYAMYAPAAGIYVKSAIYNGDNTTTELTTDKWTIETDADEKKGTTTNVDAYAQYEEFNSRSINANDAESICIGSVVTLVNGEKSADEKYRFKGWYKLDSGSYSPITLGDDKKLTLENTSTTVYALFEEYNTANVIVEYSTDSGYVPDDTGEIATATIDSTGKLKKGTQVTLATTKASTATAADYEFEGWYVKENGASTATSLDKTDVNISEKLTSDCTYIARYKPIGKVSVKILTKVNNNDGEDYVVGEVENTKQFVNGTEAYNTNIPVNTGLNPELTQTNNSAYYTFSGFGGPDSTAPVADYNPTINKDTTIYAYYDIKQATVHIETEWSDDGVHYTRSEVAGSKQYVNGNLCGASGVTVNKGSKVKLTADNGTKYYFIGYYDGSGKEISNIQTVDSDSVTYYARYNIKKVSVKILTKYNNGGTTSFTEGEVEGSTQKVNGNDAYDKNVEVNMGSTPIITATDGNMYNFIGFYNETDSIINETSPFTMGAVNDDVTIYAKYSIKKVNVTILTKYSNDGATYSVDEVAGSTQTVNETNAYKTPVTVNMGSKPTLDATDGTKYTFSGFGGPDSTVPVVNYNPTVSNDITIYAYYDIKTVTVTMDTKISTDDGATYSVDEVAGSTQKVNETNAYKTPVTVNMGSKPTLDATNGTYYTFVGFYTAGGEKLDQTSPYTLTTGVETDTTIYAYYKIKKVTVTILTKYSNDGATYSVDEVAGSTQTVNETNAYKTPVTVNMGSKPTLDATDGTDYAFVGFGGPDSTAPVTGYKPDTSSSIVVYAYYNNSKVKVKVLTKYRDNNTSPYEAGEVENANPTVNGSPAYDTFVEIAKGSTPKLKASNTSKYKLMGFGGPDSTAPVADYSPVINDAETIIYAYYEIDKQTIKTTFKYYQRSFENGVPLDINKTATEYTINIEMDSSATYEDFLSEASKSFKIISPTDEYTMHTEGTNETHKDQYDQGAADDGEKWVTFMDASKNKYYETDNLSLTDKMSAKGIEEAVIWLGNTARKYTVNLYFPTESTDLTVKGDRAVLTGAGDGESYTAYYNVRLGEKLDDGSDGATKYLEGYKVAGYINEELVAPEEKIGAYKFAYWSTDRDGNNPVSTDRYYAYRITKDLNLYAVYSTSESEMKGVSISSVATDYFVSSTGTKKVSINDVVAIYGSKPTDPEYSPTVNNVGIVYVKVDNVSGVNAATIRNYIFSNPDIFTVDNNKHSIPGTNGAIVYYYGVGGTDGVTLTNKNRVQLSFTANASKFEGSSTYSDLIVFAVANIDGGYYVSESYVVYKNAEPSEGHI